MLNLEPNIRNAVRALIIRDSRVLLIRKKYDDGIEMFALPGGGQDTGETLATALVRECKEEVGADISNIALLHVVDWFKLRNSTPPSTRQHVEFLFACDVDNSYAPQNGHHPDKHQVEVIWVKLNALDNIPCHPNSMLALMSDILSKKTVIYLGND
ncbi:MAG: NUDIX domain-containing protein [Gammaproteobacteria bacterium]|nr:NUDIX domain-containing protein [Gammaproteobacteria bacterium]